MDRKPTHEELETRVEERTAELLKLNDQLNREINERKAVEKVLAESEERYRLLFENAGALIQVFDSSGICRMINETAASYYEGAPEDFIGKSIHDLQTVAPDKYMKRHLEIVHSGKGRVFDEWVKLPSGKKRWMLSNAHPIKDANGSVFAVQVISQDITERRQTEEALRESEASYRALVEDTPMFICRFSPDRKISYVNNAYCDYFGKTSEELVGKKFTSLIPETDRETVIANLSSLSADSPILTHEHKVIRPNGEIRWQKWTNRALPNSQEQIIAYQAIGEDITERKRAEKALREREEKYRDLVETVNDVIWEVDIDGRYTYISPKVQETLGYSPDELIGRPFYDIMEPDEAHRVTGIFDEFTAEPNTFTGLETTPIHRDGYEITLENSGKPFFSPEGVLLGYRGVNRDITQRKHVEKAMRESEKEYRNLFNSIPDPVIIIQENANVIINRAVTTLFGYDGHDIEKGLSPFDLIKGDDARKNARERVKKRLSGKTVTPEFDYMEIIDKEGNSIPCEGRGTLIQYKENPADLVIFRDITERKKAEELIRTLSHKLIDSQENERQMISRELHDRVAQDISISRINCELLLKYKSLTPGIRKKIFKISDSLRSTLMAVRDLSYTLRPPGLEELGLIQTLSEFCSEFSENSGIDVDFISAGMDNLSLGYGANINVYRLVQEGLNNVRKHADAGRVMVKLTASYPKIILRIEDNGKGFNMNERLAAVPGERRMGIQSMQERVVLLGGKMSIQSFPEKGTKILVEFAYNAEKKRN